MVTVPGYTKDWSWREEDVAEVANKILEFKKVNHLPKWLRDLQLLDNILRIDVNCAPLTIKITSGSKWA